eukprot:CCRYP_000811-RB/>CCRYP_000811-RB protein AED:0.24 eAED:0.24 QI:184/1/1/1/0.8/0.66/6/1746/1055
MATSSTPDPPVSPLQSPAMQGNKESSSVPLVSTNASAPLLVEIAPNTPAAEALAANSSIRVSKLHKAARSTRLQASIRVLKSAARTVGGQPGHAGDRRGAPNFVAPYQQREGRASGGGGGSGVAPTAGHPPTILEEGEDDDERRIPPEGAGLQDEESSLNDDDSVTSSVGPLDKSLVIDDDLKFSSSPYPPPPLAPPSTPTTMHHRHNITPPVTHAALPAAIAAACRAAEELERQRMSSSGEERRAPPSLLHLFKPSSHAVPPPPPFSSGEMTPAVQLMPAMLRRRSSDSNVVVRSVSSRERRMSLEGSQLLIMPSEIQLDDDALEQTNVGLGGGEEVEEEDDLSEDLDDVAITTLEGERGTPSSLLTPKEKDDGDTPAITISMPSTPTPPKLDSVTMEETNEESAIVDTININININNHSQHTPPYDQENIDSLLSSSKKRSRRLKLSSIKNPIDESFHFHGPRSVRNWVRRRRREIEHDHMRSYVKGKVIDGQHELFIMSIAIMLGMRTSIGRTNMQMSETSHNERRWLDNDDLMAVEKYVFPPRGSEITPPHQLNHTFKFKDYSPHAFAYLRRMFGVNEYEFLLSVCGNANYIEFQSNAKSGQFFFYSKDGKYMIKTMTNAESKFLRRITPHYFRHCALNPNTLITKFLGMYRVKLYHLRRNVKFVVMKSVYDTDKHLHQVFDVKGSSTGRDAKPGEAVKKDNDVRRSLPDGAFVLEDGLRDRLRMQVERDCQWLKAMKIMDYSMLIGVHNISLRPQKRPVSTPGKPRPKSLTNTDDGTNQSHSLLSSQIGDDGDEFSHASFDASYMTLDRYLDEDDDDSYLEGSSRQRNKPRVAYEISSSDDACTSVRVLKSSDATNGHDQKESELYVEKAIEDMYWPFHRYYDLQGRRRLIPIKDELIAEENRHRNGEEHIHPKPMSQKIYLKFLSSSHSPSSFGDSPQYQIPAFEKPLSERKDGGFMMDLKDVETPLKLSVPGAPHMAEYCDGKIFYMGIIDILQQFNIRKRLEARWRRMGGKDWEAASCVHPTIYADRFMRFFDEYTAGHLNHDSDDS